MLVGILTVTLSDTAFVFYFFFCFLFFFLLAVFKVSTELKNKRMGKRVMKTHFTPPRYDSGTCQVQF